MSLSSPNSSRRQATPQALARETLAWLSDGAGSGARKLRFQTLHHQLRQETAQRMAMPSRRSSSVDAKGDNLAWRSDGLAPGLARATEVQRPSRRSAALPGLIAGAWDEAGRGPWQAPAVAAAVILG